MITRAVVAFVLLLVDVVVVVVAVVAVVIVVSDRDRPSEMLAAFTAAADQGSWAVCQWRGASGKVILPPIWE